MLRSMIIIIFYYFVLFIYLFIFHFISKLVLFLLYLNSYKIYRYLVFYESGKNTKMLDNYVKVIDKIKDEILSFINELKDNYLGSEI